MTFNEFIALQQEYKNMEDAREKLGETLYDAIQEDGNYTSDIGKYTLLEILSCKNEKEFEIVNNVVTAICGWNLETLLQRIKDRDADENFFWESI